MRHSEPRHNGEAGKALVVVELENKPGTLILPSPVQDRLTGTRHSDEIIIQPYEILILAPDDLNCDGDGKSGEINRAETVVGEALENETACAS